MEFEGKRTEKRLHESAAGKLLLKCLQKEMSKVLTCIDSSASQMLNRMAADA